MSINNYRGRVIAIALWWAASLCSPAWSATLEGTLVEAVDADTLIVDVNGVSTTVELFGIDAPEIGQPFGEEATSEVARFVGRSVVIDVKATAGNDVIGKVVADGQDIALVLTDRGLAWVAEEGSSDDRYVVSILTSRHASRGLWADPEPMHPFRWRRDHPVVHRTKTVRLEDVAADVGLERDADGKVVIDSSQVPSRFARYAEGKLFVNRMITIAQVTAWIDQADRVWQTYCADESLKDANGSVWSQQLGAWVESSTAPRGCEDLSIQIAQAERWAAKAKSVAFEEAERGGIAGSDIRTVSEALDIDD